MSYHALQLTGRNADRASDIVQEALALFVERKLYRQLPEDKGLKALLEITEEVWRDTSQWSAEAAEIPIADTAHIQAFVLPDDKGVELDLVIRSLRPDLKRMLELLRDGMSLREIAQDMHLSYSALGVRLHRLRKKLREQRG